MNGIIPSASLLGPCAGLPFAQAVPCAQACKAAFDAHDQTPEGRGDPSKCAALLRFPNGAIFWSSKLAIDADGAAAGLGFLSGRALDHDSGQDDTSWHFDTGRALSSEAHPFFVIPEGDFRFATGLKLGDLAVIIYGTSVTAAMAGDLGPPHKIGEASICLHMGLQPLAPDPCHARDDQGRCLRIRNASIDSDVLFIAFPGSAIAGLTWDTAGAQIRARAYELFAQLQTNHQ